MLKVLEFLTFCLIVAANAAVLSCVVLAGRAGRKMTHATRGDGVGETPRQSRAE
jgi:hypothetical protein